MFTNKTYLKAASVKLLAEKVYDENGRGITFKDIISEFEVKKPKAQRTLKHFHAKKVLFTAYDLEKEGFHIKGIKRERPQRYYSISSKTKVMERLKNNVPKDTTEYWDPLGPLKAHNFETLLRLLSYAILYIHKLQIQIWINKENYEFLQDIETQDNSKVVIERIGNHTVELRFHPNGAIMIYVSCSYQPFRLFNDQNVSDILVFLGRIKQKLECFER